MNVHTIESIEFPWNPISSFTTQSKLTEPETGSRN